jgi:hypothetical protein
MLDPVDCADCAELAREEADLPLGLVARFLPLSRLAVFPAVLISPTEMEPVPDPEAEAEAAEAAEGER